MGFLQSGGYALICFFLIYSFLGWCVEVCFSAIRKGICVNRGFLNGPVCPIYGFGMIIISTVLEPLKDNLLWLFLGSVIFCSLLELVTGYLLKQLFHTSWWDYSKEKFQLGGYICLRFSLVWGLAGTAVMKIVHPAISVGVDFLRNPAGCSLLAVFLAMLAIDCVVTLNTISKLNRNLGEITHLTRLLQATGDVLAENLAENAQTAHEKYTEGKDALEQTKDAFVDGAQIRYVEGKEAFSQKKSEFTHSAHQKYAELNRRLEALRDELQDTRLFGAGRLLRAFPKMKSKDYTEALEDILKRIQRKK